jgi:putative chitinase
MTQQGKKWAIRGGATLVLIFFVNFALLRSKEQKVIQAAATTFSEEPSTIQQDSIRQIVRAFRKYGDGDKRKLAYILATARHESRFKPIKEYRGKVGTAHRITQDRYWGTGYYGRGFVQLTWERNYAKMSDLLGVDLVANPDLALEPVYAAKILVYGMMNGSFTRKALDAYINDTQVDYYNARRTVNGTDRATLIANYATLIYQNL